MSLTPKQARFVEEYLLDLNATAAAKRAGYSERTAKQQGQRLLTNVDVQAAVTEAQKARSERTNTEADEVVLELKRLAFSNIRQYVEWGPDGVKLKDSTGLNDAASCCIAEVSETKSEKGGTVKFKLHDKRGALTDLMRHLGLFNDNLNLGGSIGLRWEDVLKDLE